MKDWLIKKALVFVLNILIKYDSFLFTLVTKDTKLIALFDAVTDEVLKYAKLHIEENGSESMPYVAPKIEQVEIPEFKEWADARKNFRVPIKKRKL